MTEIDQYDYDLPRELIAQRPLIRRSDARLLVADRAAGTLSHAHVRDLPEFLRPGDCLVLNDTRVIAARLVGYRTRTGGRWVGLFLSADAQGLWKVLGRTRGRLCPGDTITLRDVRGCDDVFVTVVAQMDDGSWAVRPASDQSPVEILDRVGRIPLPPYIRGGAMIDADRQDYQTVFAAKPGAVAAPTAGLHFTEALLARLEQRGVLLCRVTLHVGPGTFQPIKATRLAEHRMHAEWGCLDDCAAETLRHRRSAGSRIVAVGTTSLRVLETAARSGRLEAWQGETNLFVRPPFTFHAVDALLTNFHLPRSTLLVLVRTFGGDELMRQAYEEAIREAYRFFSYGDAMLIL